MGKCSAEMPQQQATRSKTSSFPLNSCLFAGTPMSFLNPGNISNLHKKTRDLTPEWIEGIRLRCAKNVDANRTVYAEWMMGNNTPVGFRFGGMLGGRDGKGIANSPVLVGDTNPSTLATNLYFLYQPWRQIKFETKIQTSASDFRNSIGLLEYSGERSTISLTFYNPRRDAGRMTIGFLQSFDDNLCAGVELLTAWSDRNQVQANVALAARYSFANSSIATTVSKDALDVSVWHQPSDILQLGASFIFNKRTSKAVGSFGYQLEMKDAIIKGMIDSDWSVGCTYNRQLKNLASTFGFSVLFCIPTNKFYCGLKYELNSNLQ